MKNLKVNLHITEKCNYRCRHCFAHFDRKTDLPLEKWLQIIDNIKASKIVSAINFAGGEPVFYRGFNELLRYAKDNSFEVSLISNGSLLLNPELFKPENFECLSTLGLSIDSLNENTLHILGRCDANHKVLSEERLCEIINTAKRVNPSIKIKFNTVVSKLNLHECLTQIEQKIHVDRWKFLKIKAFNDNNFSNLNLLVSDDEFAYFIARNKRTEGPVILEKTTARSYIVIDNQGNLLDNLNEQYEIVGNLLHESFADVFSRYQFDRELYKSRYN